MNSYYFNNIHRWKKGGKYYKYEPISSGGWFSVNHGEFIIYFN